MNICYSRPWPAFGRQGLEKPPNPLTISRDLVVSLVSRHFEYGKCLETGELTKFFEYFKGFDRFTVSRHFWIRSVAINVKNDQIFCERKLLRYLEYDRNGHWIRKVSRIRKTLKILCEAKLLLTGGTDWPWKYGRGVTEYGKCLETGKTTKSLENINCCRIPGILLFFMFQDTFLI